MFKKYDAYKDSGVDWLGKIPEEWSIKPGLVAFSENKRSNKGMVRNTVLSLSYGKIIIKPEEKLVGLVPESFETYQLVEPSDIIIRCTDLQNDQTSLRTGLAKDIGIITSAYLNLNVKQGFDSKYLHYYLHALDTTKVLYKLGSGLRQNLSFLDFKRLPVLDIPLSEQKKISSFLDQKTSEIDQAIAIKEQQIVLLKERKQIVIQKAVTQGLNPNVPMKDSGVELIGNIPTHWEIKKTKYASFINQNTLPETYDRKSLISYVDIGNVSFEKGIKDVQTFRFGDAPSRARRLAKCGDTVVSTVRTYLKAITYVGENSRDYVYSTGFAILSPRKDIYPKFLASFIKSHAFTHQVDIVAKGMSYPAINSTELSNLWIVLPPYNEQKELANFLDKQITQLDQIIDHKKIEIHKLEEYKTTLINDAVTGKIKVA
ncbi:restriction endonuclease subunit S [Acinetobacter lwoffii]|uniref:restriction endonuclease subunit S n=1 Tax=Acinetobacter lwoffii TaxID=28090 RepID=UPI003F91A71A